MTMFKVEFERYMSAINNDITSLELVICMLEQHKANFEYAEIEKVINFFKGNLARAKLEKNKTSELSWYIEDENNKDENN